VTLPPFVTEVGVTVSPVHTGVTTVLFVNVFSHIAGVVVCPFTKHFAVYVPVGVAGTMIVPVGLVYEANVDPVGPVTTIE
jgi:hypothetical protein